MKKRFVLLTFIVLCSTSAVARVRHYNVRQLYSGEAKPRAEVAWVWLDYGVYITDIDGSPVARTAKPVIEMSMSERKCLNSNHSTIVELSPGNHEVWVAYNDNMDQSKFKLPLKVDAKAGENYEVQANFKVHFKGENNWNPAIVPFAPDMAKVEIVTECRQ
jgi:hypothetical protein